AVRLPLPGGAGGGTLGARVRSRVRRRLRRGPAPRSGRGRGVALGADGRGPSGGGRGAGALHALVPPGPGASPGDRGWIARAGSPSGTSGRPSLAFTRAGRRFPGPPGSGGGRSY